MARRDVRRARLRPLPGDELIPTSRVVTPLPDRLWRLVSGPWYSTPEHPIVDDDCWYWFGRAKAGVYRVRNGRRVPVQRLDMDYGRIRRGGRAEGVVAAHVAAFEVTYGPVPAGLQVRHTCNHSLCCNPGHLVAGTVAQNAADRVGRRVRELLRAS